MSSDLKLDDGGQEVRLGPKTVTVPEYWQKVRIEDVSEVVTRGKQPTYVDEGGVPVLNQSCIYWDGFHEDELRWLDEDVAEDWKEKYFVQKGDVLINSTGKGTLGRAICWSASSGEVALDSHITRVSVNQEKISPEYLRYYLESRWGQTMLYVYCVSGSTGQIELSKTDLLSMPILVPPLSEQQRIADVLSKVDSRIQQTSSIIEEMQGLKTGLYQDLFTKGFYDHKNTKSRRLIEVPANWEIRPLSDFTIESAYGPRFSSDEYDEDGNIATLRTTDLKEDGGINHQTMPLADLDQSEFKEHFLEVGDFVISRSGANCGICTVWDGYDVPTVPGAYMIRFRLSEELNPYYLREFVNSTVGSKLVDVLARGSSQKNLAGSDLLSMPIPVPSRDEQDKIVDVGNKINSRLRVEREIKQSLQELKRGLMQDLLTGKRRLETDEK